jgi:hypothetical protein
MNIFLKHINNKIEVIYPKWRRNHVIQAMKSAHPYEEVAYEITSLSNVYSIAFMFVMSLFAIGNMLLKVR